MNENESVEVAHGCEFSCQPSDWSLLCFSLQHCDLRWDQVDEAANGFQLYALC